MEGWVQGTMHHLLLGSSLMYAPTFFVLARLREFDTRMKEVGMLTNVAGLWCVEPSPPHHF